MSMKLKTIIWFNEMVLFLWVPGYLETNSNDDTIVIIIK